MSIWRQQFPPKHRYLSVKVHGSAPHNRLSVFTTVIILSHTMTGMFVGGYMF
jgi:hypothetical protein